MDVKNRSVSSGVVTTTRGAGRYDNKDFYLEYDRRSRPFYLEHQVVHSEGHPFHLIGRTNEDVGGQFLSQKVEVDPLSLGLSISSWSGNGWNERFAEGIVVPEEVSWWLRSSRTAQQISDACPPPLSEFTLAGLGTTAIATVAPTNPLADAASTIGELREGLPSIPQRSGNIGGDYLGFQFGVMPLVGELNAYRASWEKADELLAQLERDSGRRVRRKFEFEPTVSIETVRNRTAPVLLHGQVPTAYNIEWGTRDREVATTTRQRVWFSGAFTYHLPKEGWRRSLRELDYLYGVQPGIDTAWELTPWSWLVDWFSNVGDVLSNITAFANDGLVMQYGYIMAETKKTVDFTCPIRVSDLGVFRDEMLTARVTYTTQQRSQATPFGFGINMEALTGRQIAILAALGYSRA